MKHFKSLLSLLLVPLLLVSCHVEKEPETTESAVPEQVSVVTLNGSTGFGIANLWEQYSGDTTVAFSVESDASVVSSKLLTGDCDIACLPTNASANLYQKTSGKVQVLAVNTAGCLFLVSKADKAVTSISDLSGKTVYAPAQNPTFIFRYLIQANGISDVTVDNTYSAASDLRDALVSGKIDYAVLPEPMVTIAVSGAQKAGLSLQVSLDLTACWNALDGMDGTLVQGCIVARTDFVKQYPEWVKTFLSDYKNSLEKTVNQPAESAQLIVKYGIFTNETVAEKAIPKCNIVYMDGNEMKNAMQKYLKTLYDLAPASIGNALPDDGFYADVSLSN